MRSSPAAFLSPASCERTHAPLGEERKPKETLLEVRPFPLLFVSHYLPKRNPRTAHIRCRKTIYMNTAGRVTRHPARRGAAAPGVRTGRPCPSQPNFTRQEAAGAGGHAPATSVLRSSSGRRPRTTAEDDREGLLWVFQHQGVDAPLPGSRPPCGAERRPWHRPPARLRLAPGGLGSWVRGNSRPCSPAERWWQRLGPGEQRRSPAPRRRTPGGAGPGLQGTPRGLGTRRPPLASLCARFLEAASRIRANCHEVVQREATRPLGGCAGHGCSRPGCSGQK